MTALDDKGRCAICAKAHPEAGSLEEIKAEKAGKHLPVSKGEVIDIVEKRLAELMLMKTCEECGRKYVASSPAQKRCHHCRGTAEE